MGKVDRIFSRSATLGRVYNRLSASKRQQLGMAFDEAFEGEAEADSGGDVAAKVTAYLKPRLSKEELQAVVDALKEVIGGQAMDQDPAFSAWLEERGIPNPDNVRVGKVGGALQEGSDWNRERSGNLLAGDSDYLSQFPHANRLSADGGGEPPVKPPRPMTPRECEEYEKTFPHANRLSK